MAPSGNRIEAFLADRGYDADAIREEIVAAGVEAVIPARRNAADVTLSSDCSTD